MVVACSYRIVQFPLLRAGQSVERKNAEGVRALPVSKAGALRGVRPCGVSATTSVCCRLYGLESVKVAAVGGDGGGQTEGVRALPVSKPGAL